MSERALKTALSHYAETTGKVHELNPPQPHTEAEPGVAISMFTQQLLSARCVFKLFRPDEKLIGDDMPKRNFLKIDP